MNLSLKIRRLLGYRLMNFIGHLLALCIPSSVMRKRFRKWFISPSEENYAHKVILRKLRNTPGIQFEQFNGATTAIWNGLRFGRITESPETFIFVGEILCGEYHFDTQGKAVVIDIGMNCGYVSLYFASRNDVQAVYAFEPVPATYQRALSNFHMNPQCDAKIHARNYGLGDSDKEVTVDFVESDSGRTTTIASPPESVVARARNQGGVKLQVQIKDAEAEIGKIIQNHPHEQIVLKCDCEGAEKEIFERLNEHGYLSAIDVVVMEYHFGYSQSIMQLLAKYSFTHFSNGGAIGIIRAVNTRPDRY